jgi:hypothetical protein
VALGIVLIGLTKDVSAAPIGLDNDVDLDWADLPCQPATGPTPPAGEPLCERVDGEWRLKPVEELIQIVGAPRLVPDASDAGNLLGISVDFLAVSLEGTPDFPTPLILNVFDVDLNPLPLQLTYFIPASTNQSVEAPDLLLTLSDFVGFNLLPQGDLIFTVSFDPRLALTDRSSTRPDHVVEIRFSGPGTTEAPDPEPVPEPGTLVLLLSGLAASGLGAARRRRRWD